MEKIERTELKFETGSAESILTRFLYGWKIRKLDMLMDMSDVVWKAKGHPKHKLEIWFGDKSFVGSKILKVIEYPEIGHADVHVMIGYRYKGKAQSKICVVHLKRQDYSGNSIRGDYKVEPVSVFKWMME